MPSSVLVQGFEETYMNHTSGDVTFTYFQLKNNVKPSSKETPFAMGHGDDGVEVLDFQESKVINHYQS